MKDYIYQEYTKSFCHICKKQADAKIVTKDNKVYLIKQCDVHGEIIELLEADANYYLNRKKYDKPGTPSKIQTELSKGCPYDCGLCKEHEQHTCIGLIEITNNCDLCCPLCYANAKTDSEFLSLETIEKMMDFYIEAENGKAEILQISGGEPTTHPELLKIIELSRSKNIGYTMLNTNGLRIAEDENFVYELSKFKSRFEVYLQFDGFTEDVYQKLRGRDLMEIKNKAIKNLTKYEIPTTLVATIKEGVNDMQLGELFSYAINTDYIRGLNLQPAAYFGRTIDEVNISRTTMTDIINKLEKQTGSMIRSTDFIPLPCNTDRVSISFLYKQKGSFIPITRGFDDSELLPLINNTFAFSIEDTLKNVKSFNGLCDCMSFVKHIVPKGYLMKTAKEKMDFVDKDTFRISISSFVDFNNFDRRAMQKECVHMITEDLKRIPFSAYNMIYRDQKR